jgi:hypothetical protein
VPLSGLKHRGRTAATRQRPAKSPLVMQDRSQGRRSPLDVARRDPAPARVIVGARPPASARAGMSAGLRRGSPKRFARRRRSRSTVPSEASSVGAGFSVRPLALLQCSLARASPCGPQPAPRPRLWAPCHNSRAGRDSPAN